jgi:hypothetical protein
MDGQQGGSTYKRACWLVTRALRANDNYHTFRAAMRKMYNLVRFMQKKFHARFVAKTTKAQLIDDLWFKLLDEVREKAAESSSDSSKRVLDLCAAIDDVPAEIRKHVLGGYQQQMQKLSWIYFYNTRRVVRADVCDHDEIGLQIFKLQNWLKDDLLNSKDSDLLSDETLLLSEISDNDLREFGLLESLEAMKKSSNSNINSFHEIGWIDPFPKLGLALMKKGKWRKLAKKSAAKVQGPKMSDAKKMALDYLDAIDDVDVMKPILSLALPSRILFFKIMRACIAVKQKEHLWMYVHDD